MSRHRDSGVASGERPDRDGRRTCLKVIATAGLAGIAGCLERNPSPDPPPPTVDDETTSPASTAETPSSTSPSRPTTTAGNRCAEPLSTPPDPSDSPSEGGAVVWERPFSTRLQSLTPLDENRLLVARDDGTLAALTRDTGSVSWESDIADTLSAPLIEGDTVIVRGRTQSEDDEGPEVTLHALDAASGEERWTTLTMGAGMAGGFEVIDTTRDAVLVRETTDFEPTEMPLHAVSLADGSTQWSIEVGYHRESYVRDGTIYYVAYRGVTAIDADGSRRWEWSLGTSGSDSDQSITAAAIVCDRVIVRSEKRTDSDPPYRYTVHGVDIATGEGRWTFDAGSRANLDSHRGRLFVGGDNHARLNPESGDPVWTSDRSTYGMEIAYGMVFGSTGSTEQMTMIAETIPDGSVEWSLEFDTAALPEGVTKGRVLTSIWTDDESYMGAIDAKTGDQQWELQAEHTFDWGGGPARWTDGSVIGSERVYVIDQPDQDDGQGTVRAVTV